MWQKQAWYKYGYVALFSLNFAMSLFFIPVLLLFYVQVKNLLLNKTTYERARGQKVTNSFVKNPSNNLTFRNCKTMCDDNK